MGNSVEVQTDFSGGMRRDALIYADNECADVSGFWHHRGALESMKGPLAIGGYAGSANDRDELTIYSHGTYKHQDGRIFLVERRASSLWLGLPDMDYDRPSSTGAVLYDLKDITENCKAANPAHGDLVNHGTLTEKLWSGNVRSFNNGAYLSVDESATDMNTSSFTLEAWIKVPTTASAINEYIIIDNRVTGTTKRGYLLSVNMGCLLCEVNEDFGNAAKHILAWDNHAVTGRDLRDGAWHHVAAVWNRDGGAYTALLLYVDGTVAVNPTFSGTVAYHNTTTAGQVFRVGLDVDGDNGFYGDIGTVSIKAEAYSEATIDAHYTAEAPRYAAAGEVNYNWYPMHGNSITTSNANYIRERSKVCGETFVQWGENLYCASDEPGLQDYLLTWRGTVICKGSVISSSDVNGTLYTQAGTDYLWQIDVGTGDLDTDGPIPGDTIYLYDHTGTGEWQLTGHTIKFVKRNGDTCTVHVHGDGWSTTGKGSGGGNYCDYVIVRTHRMGTQEAGTCTAADAGSGSGLTGTYNYIWRYVNTLTGGYYGAFSSIGTVTVTSNDVTLSGWATNPTDLRVNRLEIYRQTVDTDGNGGAYYIVKAVDMIDYAAGADATEYWQRVALASTYTDNGLADGDALTDTATEYYERPGAYSNIRAFRQILYAVDNNLLRFSSLGLPEYMSTADSRTTLVTEAELQGGSIEIGQNIKDRITAYIPEVGAYQSSGISGANLLVFTKSNAFRWYGDSRSTFQLVPTFAVGAVNQKTVANAGGLIVWCDGDKVWSLASGADVPVEISGKMWPYGIRNYITAADKEGCLEAWCADYWQGYYLLSGSESSASPNTIWCYHVASGTWTRYAMGVRDFSQWTRPGNPGGWVITGSPVADTPTGELDMLWGNSSVHVFSVTSRPLMPNDTEPDTLLCDRHISRIASVWKAPLTSDITVTITPYTDGDTTTPAATATTGTIAHVDTATGQRRIVRSGALACNGWILQVKITGSSIVSGTRLEAIVPEFARHGKA